MSRKTKINPDLKVELVEKYLNGEIGMQEAVEPLPNLTSTMV